MGVGDPQPLPEDVYTNDAPIKSAKRKKKKRKSKLSAHAKMLAMRSALNRSR